MKRTSPTTSRFPSPLQCSESDEKIRDVALGKAWERGILTSHLLTWYLGNLSAFWACWAGCDRVMDLELGSRKPRVGLIQGLAESLENSRSMR